jgi:hypothetical protein
VTALGQPTPPPTGRAHFPRSIVTGRYGGGPPASGRIAGTTVTWWVNAVSDTGEKVSTGMAATTVDCPAGG